LAEGFPQQVAEKWPSAAFPSSFVAAAYSQVRLTPQEFGGLASGPFLSNLGKMTFSAASKDSGKSLFPLNNDLLGFESQRLEFLRGY